MIIPRFLRQTEDVKSKTPFAEFRSLKENKPKITFSWCCVRGYESYPTLLKVSTFKTLRKHSNNPLICKREVSGCGSLLQPEPSSTLFNKVSTHVALISIALIWSLSLLCYNSMLMLQPLSLTVYYQYCSVNRSPLSHGGAQSATACMKLKRLASQSGLPGMLCVKEGLHMPLTFVNDSDVHTGHSLSPPWITPR